MTTAMAAVLGPGAATAASAPDAFYTYTGSKPLADYAPGAILKTRTLAYSLAGLSLPVRVKQIVFRTTNQRGRAVAGVTSVLEPLTGATSKVIGYQSFYDSLNPEDGPSRAIAGGTNPGGLAAHFETAMMTQFLLQGYAVVIADTQGPTADFAAGPEYGMVTLDSMRAALAASGTGIAPGARAGLIGYSGGAIATNWASVLAPAYAPDINRRLVGAAEGGVLVRPSANLRYIDGSLVWAGVMPMAVVGVARGFGIDLTPYLSDYGKQVYAKLQNASITQVLGAYPGLTWKKLVKPAYVDPASIPIFVSTVNKLNLGTRPNPTIPMFIGQGTLGEAEGTLASKAGLGPGDGVMIAGDVRSLARKYCAAGVRVVHHEYPLSHFSSVPVWLPQATSWLTARFSGTTAPTNCSTIKAGNPLTPLKPA
ncbi:lipase family protein [Nocardioides jiangxiensis]|uniref:Lipase family protein n=1 Tax=Nocardioides jiangxiensis TaxID=3064524 RepID=A0ABT9B6L0_9ACTN|nr:lipase family protein [Nocardioides sp. WY-20]MDO7868773.1 lipase family protein [Nocardioides sp. WY-20]